MINELYNGTNTSLGKLQIFSCLSYMNSLIKARLPSLNDQGNECTDKVSQLAGRKWGFPLRSV